TVEAPVVVLSAGAVATPDLLLRSRIANRSGLVGRGLHLHPSVMVAGIFDEPLHAYRGIPQSWYVDEFIDLERDPHSGYVLMPITGFPALTATQLPGFGREHFRWMRAFAHTAGLLVLLHDRSEGSVEPGGSLARPRLRYALTPDDERLLAEGLVHCCELLFAAGAREVLVPYLDEPLVLRPGDDLSVIVRRGAAHDPDRLHAPAVDLPDGRRPAPLGGERVGRVPRGGRPVRGRHERVPHLAGRAAADHDRGARRPHRPPRARALARAGGLTRVSARGSRAARRPPSTVRRSR